MQKTLISTMVCLALLSAGTAGAKSIPIDVSKLNQIKAASSPYERQYDGRVFLEFSKPVSRFAEGEAIKLVESLQDASSVPLSFEKIMMKRFIVVSIDGARSDADVLAAVGRLAGAKGVLTVKPNRYLKAQSAESFNNPGWSPQFGFYSRDRDFNNNLFTNNPRILELTDFFDGFNFGETRLSLVDSFFTEVPNMPHSVYAQRQTILDGQYSHDLVDRGTSSPHGLQMAAYLKGQVNSTYGTVGMGYSTLPLLAITVFDPVTNRASDFDVAEGILYSMNLHDTAATNPNPNPAKVINLSLGAFGFDCSDSAVYQAAIDVATNAGGLIVAAAGNNGEPRLNLPANCNNVISVGAASYNSSLANFSNYAPEMSVSAISSTFESQSSAGNGFVYSTTVPSGPDGAQDGVTTVAGTSIAAPYISLLLTYAKAVNPSLSFTEALALIKRNSVAFREGDTRCAGIEACGGIINPVTFIQEVGGANLLAFNQYSQSSPPPVDEPPVDEPPVDEPPVDEPAEESFVVSIAGTASNPTNVRVFLGSEEQLDAFVQTTEDSITVRPSGSGNYEVRFMATPNTNTMSASASSTALYRFFVDTTNSPATVSAVERLSDPTVPGDESQAPSPAPVASSSGGGGGGGGSMSLFGLLGLGVLVSFMKRKSANVIR